MNPWLASRALESAIRLGWSANESLRRYRREGGTVRRQDWLWLYRQARVNASRAGRKITFPLHRRAEESSVVSYPLSGHRLVAFRQRGGWYTYQSHLAARHLSSRERVLLNWSYRTKTRLSWKTAIFRTIQDANETLNAEYRSYVILAVLPRELRRYE